MGCVGGCTGCVGCSFLGGFFGSSSCCGGCGSGISGGLFGSGLSFCGGLFGGCLGLSGSLFSGGLSFSGCVLCGFCCGSALLSKSTGLVVQLFDDRLRLLGDLLRHSACLACQRSTDSTCCSSSGIRDDRCVLAHLSSSLSQLFGTSLSVFGNLSTRFVEVFDHFDRCLSSGAGLSFDFGSSLIGGSLRRANRIVDELFGLSATLVKRLGDRFRRSA